MKINDSASCVLFRFCEQGTEGAQSKQIFASSCLIDSVRLSVSAAQW